MKYTLSKMMKKTVLVAVIASAAIAGKAQAHAGMDYAIPMQLLLLNSVLDHGRHHEHHYQVIRKQVHQHHGGHHKHGRIKHRRHSHSRDGYRHESRGRGRHRH